MKRIFLTIIPAALVIMLAPASARATDLYFPVQTMTGSTNDVVINVRPASNPVIFNGAFYYLPVDGTNFTSTNAIAYGSLIPGRYNATIQGIAKSWQITVTNSGALVNAADLSSGVTFYSGIHTLRGANGVEVTVGAPGDYIISGSGSGLPTTNASQLVTGTLADALLSAAAQASLVRANAALTNPAVFDAAGTAVTQSQQATNNYTASMLQSGTLSYGVLPNSVVTNTAATNASLPSIAANTLFLPTNSAAGGTTQTNLPVATITNLNSDVISAGTVRAGTFLTTNTGPGGLDMLSADGTVTNVTLDASTSSLSLTNGSATAVLDTTGLFVQGARAPLASDLRTATNNIQFALRPADLGNESIPVTIQTNLPAVGSYTYMWSPQLVYDSYRKLVYAFRSAANVHGDTNNVVVLNISTNNGVSWGGPVTLQSSSTISLMNISAGMGANGRLCVLFGRYRLTDKDETVWSSYSDDGGSTFSTPTMISTNTTHYGSMIPFGKITRAGNSLYCGAYGTSRGTSGVEGMLLKSQDNGVTWTNLSIGYYDAVTMMYDEPSVAVRNEQELLAICRGTNGWNAFWSTNGGSSFTNLGPVFNRNAGGVVVAGASYDFPCDIFSAVVGGQEKIVMLASVRSSSSQTFYSEVNWDELPNLDNLCWNMVPVGNFMFTTNGTMGNYTGGYANGILMPDGSILAGYAYDFSTDTLNLTNSESRFFTYRPKFSTTRQSIASKTAFIGGGDFRSSFGPTVTYDPVRMSGMFVTNYRSSFLRIHGDFYNYIDYNLYPGVTTSGYYNLANTNDVGWRTTYNQSTYSLYYHTAFPNAFNQTTLVEAFRIAASTGFGLEVPSGVTTTVGGITNNSAQPIASAGGFVGNGSGLTNIQPAAVTNAAGFWNAAPSGGGGIVYHTIGGYFNIAATSTTRYAGIFGGAANTMTNSGATYFERDTVLTNWVATTDTAQTVINLPLTLMTNGVASPFAITIASNTLSATSTGGILIKAGTWCNIKATITTTTSAAINNTMEEGQ